MHCIKCGEKLSPSQTFCPFCGALNESTAEKSVIKRTADEYKTPNFEVFEKDTVYENPNKAYDHRANQFYKPHSLPHSDRRGSKRHRRRRKNSNRFLHVALPIIAFVGVLAAAYFTLRITTIARQEVNIKGSWVASSLSEESEGYTYSFTNDGFVTVKKSQYETSQTATKYCWRIEGDRLIVDDTVYNWSTNLNDYSNSEQEHWCVSGNTIYISNTHDDGYKVLNKKTK